MKSILFLFLVSIIFSCAKQQSYYTQKGFGKVDKIDVHIHVSKDRDIFVEQAGKDSFRLLNIVADVSRTHEEIVVEYNYRLDTKKKHPEGFEFVTSFSIQEWDDSDWVNNIDWIDKGIKEGAVGVKVWKNIGMVFKDKNGELIMIDDPKFDTIFNMLTDREITPKIPHV